MISLTHIEILLGLLIISQVISFSMMYNLTKRFNNLEKELTNINSSIEKSNEYLLVIARKHGYL